MNKIVSKGGALALVMTACLAVYGSASAQPKPSPKKSASSGRVDHSFFFAGGDYANGPAGQVMHGQIFVEKIAPARPRQRYPIVMIHGAAQTATNWMGTPDGREGWAEYFVSQGYVVYLVDQPARGRSAWQQGVDGKTSIFDAITVEKRFTATEKYNIWPQARLHTQWPSNDPKRGQVGDPVFDQFYASQVPYVVDNAQAQLPMRDAGAALLDRIGPAIVMTHSQSGPMGWLIGDARPKLVKAIVALEPAGPPFQDEVNDHDKARAWGVTDIPVAYDPAVTDPSQLQTELQAQPDAVDLVPCRLQKGSAVHTLANLRDIRVMLVTTEASYHAVYDHCTARYLKQAGVNTDHIRLEAIGIHGNGHMLMLEKNNLQIAKVVTSWLGKNVK